MVKEGKKSKIEKCWASGKFVQVGLTLNIVLYLRSQVSARGILLFIFYFCFVLFLFVFCFFVFFT